MKLKLITGAMAIGLAICAAQQTPPAADNTKANKGDTATTADQAKNKTSDRDLMQKIRKSLMDDKTLSTYAHNVKVIAQDGQVTLKGPVRSDEEKQSIVQKAKDIAGAGNVTDQLTIKAARVKKSS